MLSHRTLLGVTLSATFAAGGLTSWAVQEQRPQAPYLPTKAEHVYAQDLGRLRDMGYDEDELKEALRLHQEYLNSYRQWWDEFLRAYRENVDVVDQTFEAKLAELKRRHDERAGGGSRR